MPKENLKDKLDGNNLDLSLSSLSDVPVKELAALPKATRLDLSSNLLTSLPDDFCKLTHIVRLDLSQNQLTQLPHNIGSLNRLQHLDLYNNQLTTLPVSFCYFKTLKWLDLKGNPLEEPLKSVAGDCLDQIQCQNCARKVIAFMKNAQSEQERRRQQQLKEEREQEALRKMEEDKERERQKEEKKAAKEQRRKEYEAQQAGLRRRNVQKDEEVKKDTPKVASKQVPGDKLDSQKPKKEAWTWAGIFSGIMLILLIVIVGVYINCDLNPNRQFCRDGRRILDQWYHKFSALAAHYTKK